MTVVQGGRPRQTRAHVLERERTDVSIAGLLAREGYVDAAAERARAVLEEAGLTRAGKKRIATAKLPRAQEVLQARFLRFCGAAGCRTNVNGREVLQVPAANCEACGGSRNRRAGETTRRALLRAGMRNVLVLGGSPSTREDLRESLGGDGVEVRCIDGTAGARAPATVEADLRWAEALVVWASTPLPHKVSRPYTARVRVSRLPMITVARRGVEAVCQELERLAGGGG